MDNLTHTLTGLMLSRAGGWPRTVPKASLILMLAANTPDIDILAALGGSLTYLDWHRWWTHSLLLAPVLALLPLLVLRPWVRTVFASWRPYALSLLGLGSHYLLDWTNVYGIRLLTPLNDRWYRLDITHVYDYWIWAVLLLALCAPLLGRLVSQEIGARPATGRGWAWFALLLFFVYDAGRWVLHRRAVDLLQSRIYQGAAPIRVVAVPGPANPGSWQGIVETADLYQMPPVRLWQEFDPNEGPLLFKPSLGANAQAVEATAVIQHLYRFTQLPYWRVTPQGSAEPTTRYELLDLRFGVPPPGHFTGTVDVNGRGQVIDQQFRF